VGALSDRIAAEHHYAPWPDTVRGPIPYHLCAAGCEGVILEDQGDVRRHVADVTERAVRDTIAQQLANLEHTRAMTQAAIRDGVTIQWVEGFDAAAHTAARIAREGTTP